MYDLHDDSIYDKHECEENMEENTKEDLEEDIKEDAEENLKEENTKSFFEKADDFFVDHANSVFGTIIGLSTAGSLLSGIPVEEYHFEESNSFEESISFVYEDSWGDNITAGLDTLKNYDDYVQAFESKDDLTDTDVLYSQEPN